MKNCKLCFWKFGALLQKFATLVDVEKGNEVIYQIVGKDESNIAQGKISFLSPLGKALMKFLTQNPFNAFGGIRYIWVHLEALRENREENP